MEARVANGQHVQCRPAALESATCFSKQMPMFGELDPVGGGDPIPLLKEQLVIGRRSRCDISLKFPNVSSEHCELSIRDGYWYVEDLGSRNGIKVNEIRCSRQYLVPGDVLTIARHEFRIKYDLLTDQPPPEIHEDVMSMSLMEKAGLVSRKKSPEANLPRPLVEPPSKINTPDDQALQWLSEVDHPDEDDDD